MKVDQPKEYPDTGLDTVNSLAEMLTDVVCQSVRVLVDQFTAGLKQKVNSTNSGSTEDLTERTIY